MNQYDVFANPVPRARKLLPFVAILQHDLTDTERDRVIAPLVLLSQFPGTAGKLTPIVRVSGVEHALLVPQLGAISSQSLRKKKDSLAAYRLEIIQAIDLLFVGV